MHRRQALERELYAPAPVLAIGAGQDPDAAASILGNRPLDLGEIGIILCPPDRQAQVSDPRIGGAAGPPDGALDERDPIA